MTNDFTKVIFVTGGAGFIGSNYINKHVRLHPESFFVNIDCLTYAGDLNNVEVSDSTNYAFCEVDIRNRDALAKLFTEYSPTDVIHFAAESHVDLSIKNPDVFLETNIQGTHNLLSLAHKHDIQRFHFISTDEVYGAFATTEGSFTEETALAPRNPYSASKASADLMVLAYHRTYGLNVVITRSSNVYGPHQDRSKLIPSFISKLASGEVVPLYGEGKQMREWTYVEDCIDAINLVFTKGISGEVYNIGSGHELSNYDLTCEILTLMGKDTSAISYVTDRLGHDFRYSLDASKIKRELSWTPRTTFSEGLKQTRDFYTR